MDGFVVYRLERQTGPCLRDDYEFLMGTEGPLEFPSRQEAEKAALGFGLEAA